MRTRTSHTLFGYWNDVRHGRLAPRRFDIEPSRIADVLPETFILERTETGDFRFRLAGTRVCEEMGVELRGTSLYDGWGPTDRDTICHLVAGLCREGGVGVLTFWASAAGDKTAEFEMILLPLTHTRDSIDRMLGAVVHLGHEPWLGSEPLLRRRLVEHETIWPDGRPHSVSERMGQQTQTPFPPHVRKARIVRADRRQFRVYDGGLVNSEPK